VLRWLDESHGKPFNASIDGIDLSVRKLDSKGGTPAEFDAAWRLQAEPWIKGDAFRSREDGSISRSAKW
jgi:hypothetical protein